VQLRIAATISLYSAVSRTDTTSFVMTSFTQLSIKVTPFTAITAARLQEAKLLSVAAQGSRVLGHGNVPRSACRAASGLDLPAARRAAWPSGIRDLACEVPELGHRS
jgi:hypothetical protein